MSISTHVLDANSGLPAAGVEVRLTVRVEGAGSAEVGWRDVAHSHTDADGRIAQLAAGQDAGRYRISFDTGAYYTGLGIETFYPEVSVVFDIVDPSRHHHVPLLLSPFAYSTYRGS